MAIDVDHIADYPAIAHAVQHVFIWAVPAAVLIFALAWFIREAAS